MNAAPLITSGTGLYKAVCHKCQYVGFEPNSTKCPVCAFPLLLEPYGSDGLTLRDIFDRSTIEIKGRTEQPILPGVNRSARQRQEMLERAQKRLSSMHQSQPEPAASSPDHTADPTADQTGAHARAHTGGHPAGHPYWEPAQTTQPASVPGAVPMAASVMPSMSHEHAYYHQAATMPIGRGRSYWPMFVGFLLFATTAMAAASTGF